MSYNTFLYTVYSDDPNWFRFQGEYLPLNHLEILHISRANQIIGHKQEFFFIILLISQSFYIKLIHIVIHITHSSNPHFLHQFLPRMASETLSFFIHFLAIINKINHSRKFLSQPALYIHSVYFSAVFLLHKASRTFLFCCVTLYRYSLNYFVESAITCRAVSTLLDYTAHTVNSALLNTYFICASCICLFLFLFFYRSL